MERNELEKLRYPIGHFSPPEEVTDQQRSAWIYVLEEFPGRLSDIVEHLTNEQLEVPYRPGGWTLRQVVHHLADSHHNCYLRFKWALTEDNPLIKVYNEKGWASLLDSETAPVGLSLDHLRAVHAKLVYMLRGLTSDQLKRRFRHPEAGETTLDENIGRYAWHATHHYTHIENLLLAMGWNT